MKKESHIREAAVAGMFYPSHPTQLSDEVGRLLRQAPALRLKGKIIGLVIPHAGYLYSGLTAAHGYSQLAGQKYDTVVIISPSHREYFKGSSIYSGSGYKTPLGFLEVDHELRKAMISGEQNIIADETGHRAEHAVEVHLPFLQYLQCTEKILPVVMGDQRRSHCYALAEKLAGALQGDRFLIVASSDLSHYHPYDEANRLDSIVRQDIESFDDKKLMGDLEAERTEACGGGPVVAMMSAASQLGATKTKILHHCNSGDITGERDAVVGYLSAAVYRSL